jgi:hypothetical protein
MNQESREKGKFGTQEPGKRNISAKNLPDFLLS